MRVYLSPSTQEFNIGVGSFGNEEERMNQIADVVQRQLEANGGFTIFRNTPEMNVNQAIADSNSKYPDLHVSIHSNAGGGQGTEVYVKNDTSPAYPFANIVANKLSTITPGPDRGVIINNYLAEVTRTIAPSALIEVAFHDNPQDANWIVNNIEQIGTIIADAIIEYFGK